MSFLFGAMPVRVFDRNGELWWFLTDVCAVLGIGHALTVSKRLDDDEKSTVVITDSGNLNDERTLINESGLWSLVLTSRKAAAKRFKKWLTSEVIPSIRKTGGYGVANPVTVLNDPATMRGLLLTYSETVIGLEAENAVLAPKAFAFDRLTKMDGLHTLTEAAKECHCPRDRFISALHAHRWIYRRGGKGNWLGHEAKERTGLVAHRTCDVRDHDRRLVSKAQVLLTSAGLARAAELIAGMEASL